MTAFIKVEIETPAEVIHVKEETYNGEEYENQESPFQSQIDIKEEPLEYIETVHTEIKSELSNLDGEELQITTNYISSVEGNTTTVEFKTEPTLICKSGVGDEFEEPVKEGPYKCEAKGCGSTFKRGSLLALHARKHKGEKIFKCHFPMCNAKFARMNSLTKHKRIHTRFALKCDINGCNAIFDRTGKLKRHKLSHSKKPYICTCGMTVVCG